MHRYRIALVSFLLFCSPALAGPKEEALIVVGKWTKAFADSDVDRIVNLFAPDALFVGTGSKTIVNTPAEVRKYFEVALLNNRPRGALLSEPSVMVLSNTVVVVTGIDTLTGVKNGTIVNSNGRATFVIAKTEDGWKIVHFHRSAMPP